MRLFVLIGASGSGKTTLVQRLEKRFQERGAVTLYFDQIFGTAPFGKRVLIDGEDSQQIATEAWCKIIARDYRNEKQSFLMAKRVGALYKPLVLRKAWFRLS